MQLAKNAKIRHFILLFKWHACLFFLPFQFLPFARSSSRYILFVCLIRSSTRRFICPFVNRLTLDYNLFAVYSWLIRWKRDHTLFRSDKVFKDLLPPLRWFHRKTVKYLDKASSDLLYVFGIIHNTNIFECLIITIVLRIHITVLRRFESKDSENEKIAALLENVEGKTRFYTTRCSWSCPQM